MTEVIQHDSITGMGRAQEHTDLEPGLATARIDLRLHGQIQKTSGSTNDAQVFDDPLARMLTHHMTRDGAQDFIEPGTTLRDLYEYHRFNVQEVVSRTTPDKSGIDSGSAQDFEITYSLWFARRYFIPWRGWSVPVFLPPFDGSEIGGPVPQNYLRLYSQLEEEAVNSSSDPGTAAILSAGSDTYEFVDGPNLDVIQHAFSPSHPPALEPHYQSWETTYQNASSQRSINWVFDEPWDMALLRLFHDADRLLETGADTPLNNVKLGGSSASSKFLDMNEFAIEQEGVQDVAGYNGITGSGEESPGTYPILPAKGDRAQLGFDLTERIVPDDFSQLQYELDHDAPSNTPGVFHTFVAALKSRPWTRL